MALEVRQPPAQPVSTGRTQYQVAPERARVPGGTGRARFVNVHPAAGDDGEVWTCSCICGWNGPGCGSATKTRPPVPGRCTCGCAA